MSSKFENQHPRGKDGEFVAKPVQIPTPSQIASRVKAEHLTVKTYDTAAYDAAFESYEKARKEAEEALAAEAEDM